MILQSNKLVNKTWIIAKALVSPKEMLVLILLIIITKVEQK